MLTTRVSVCDGAHAMEPWQEYDAAVEATMPARRRVEVRLTDDGECCRAIDVRDADRARVLRVLYAAAAPLRRDRGDVEELPVNQARRIVRAVSLLPAAAGVVEEVHGRAIHAHLGPGVICTRRWSRLYDTPMWLVLRGVPCVRRMPVALWSCAAQRVWSEMSIERQRQELAGMQQWALG